MKYCISNVGVFLPDDREVYTEFAKSLEEAFQKILDYKWEEWSIDVIEDNGIACSDAYADKDTLYIVKGGKLWDYLMQASPQALAEANLNPGDLQPEAKQVKSHSNRRK